MTIVAPNSPIDRANPSTVAAITEGSASGSEMVRKTRNGAAPSVAATASYRRSTCSKPARAVRTNSGSPITAIASTTAFHVKTTSIPARASIPPIGPRGANSISRIRPVATGGITSGSDTSVSSSTRPRNCPRARSQASASPERSITTVAPAAVATVNR